MKILKYFIFSCFISICMYSHVYANKTNTIFIISDMLLYELYVDNSNMYPVYKLDRIMYSDEYKKLLTLNVTYYVITHNINDEFDMYVHRNKFNAIKNIMNLYLVNKISESKLTK